MTKYQHVAEPQFSRLSVYIKDTLELSCKYTQGAAQLDLKGRLMKPKMLLLTYRRPTLFW